MIKYLSIITLLLGWGSASWAQTLDAPAELNSAPPALETTITPAPAAASVAEKSTLQPTRTISYGLSMGTQFSPLFGTATYLEPSVLFPITKRFSGYASVSMISAFNNYGNRFGQEAGVEPVTNRWNQHYIVHAGGNYMVNDRLNLTGSVWRDLSKNKLSAPVNLLMPGGTNGMSIRASYKVTDNFSVSGGLRYSNGNAYQNSWYNPASNFGY